jgi:hypothetical protein
MNQENKKKGEGIIESMTTEFFSDLPAFLLS